METQLTKDIKMALWRNTHKMGTYGCFEVTIGWNERVDYMTYDTKGVFRCYEVKVSKADFCSKCKHTFAGHYNYYAMPEDLYEEIKEDIPPDVGVYVFRHKELYIAKKAKKRNVGNPEELKNDIIRALSREAAKTIENHDELHIQKLNREIGQLRREKERYRQEYWHLRRKIEGKESE